MINLLLHLLKSHVDSEKKMRSFLTSGRLPLVASIYGQNDLGGARVYL